MERLVMKPEFRHRTRVFKTWFGVWLWYCKTERCWFRGGSQEWQDTFAQAMSHTLYHDAADRRWSDMACAGSPAVPVIEGPEVERLVMRALEDTGAELHEEAALRVREIMTAHGEDPGNVTLFRLRVVQLTFAIGAAAKKAQRQ